MLLQAALIGLEQMKAAAEAKMSEIQARLGSQTTPTSRKAPRKKRRLSAEGRAAIVAALKKRWAAKKAATAQPKPAATKKAARKKAAVKRAGAKKAAKAPVKKAATKTAPAKKVAVKTAVEKKTAQPAAPEPAAQ
jgi:hypothetical protein